MEAFSDEDYEDEDEGEEEYKLAAVASKKEKQHQKRRKHQQLPTDETAGGARNQNAVATQEPERAIQSNGMVHLGTLKEWMKKYGGRRDRKKHVVKENDFDGAFHRWVQDQRRLMYEYDKNPEGMNETWYNELKDTGFKWNDVRLSVSFNDRVKQLREFVKAEGRLPKQNGDNDAPPGLGKWLCDQRGYAKKKKITLAQIQMISNVLGGDDWMQGLIRVSHWMKKQQTGPKVGKPKKD